MLSRVRLFATSRTAAHQAPLCPWDSPGKNTGVGCHFLLHVEHKEERKWGFLPWGVEGGKGFHSHSNNKKNPGKKLHPYGSAVKNIPAGQELQDSIPGSGRSPGGGHGNPLQCSYLENPMDRGAWWAAAHEATEPDTTERLSKHA